MSYGVRCRRNGWFSKGVWVGDEGRAQRFASAEEAREHVKAAGVSFSSNCCSVEEVPEDEDLSRAIDGLSPLVGWMRERGVRFLKVGDLEIELERPL